MMGTTALPVKPVTCASLSGLIGMPSSCAALAVIAEPVAPVSSTRRKGPLPSIITGAQIRPIRSRRVGATYFGSGACTMTSARVSAVAAGGAGAGAAGGRGVSAPMGAESTPSSTADMSAR